MIPNRCMPWAALAAWCAASLSAASLQWERLPDLPDPLGLGGPAVGAHNGALIVAGGTNFPVKPGEDLWSVPKAWHDKAYVLTRRPGGGYKWLTGFRLPHALGYPACVSVREGVLCMGGSDGVRPLDECLLISWNPAARRLDYKRLPPLPRPRGFPAAARIGRTVYVVGGMAGMGLETAMRNVWRLDLDHPTRWETLPPWPGPERALCLAAAQRRGGAFKLYVISGRRQKQGVQGLAGIVLLRDAYEFDPARYDAAAFDPKTGRYAGQGRFAKPWRRCADAPYCVMAGAAAAIGRSRIIVLSGADGSHIRRMVEQHIEMKDYPHPGFPRRVLAYDTEADRWTTLAASPANQVTTPAVWWSGRIILAGGEIRPRVRTRAVWAIRPTLGE